MTLTLKACLQLREHYAPGRMIDGGLECISFPFPRNVGGVGIMVRVKDDPTTMREVGIPESDWLNPDDLPRVKTNFDYPPIPIRDHDWSAWDDDTYDGAPDAGHQIVGHGRTEAEAVADFWEQWRDSQ